MFPRCAAGVYYGNLGFSCNSVNNKSLSLLLEAASGWSQKLGLKGVGDNQTFGGEEEEKRCSPSGAVCAPVSSRAPRVMGGSCAALRAASELGAAAPAEDAELCASVLRPCRGGLTTRRLIATWGGFPAGMEVAFSTGFEMTEEGRLLN